MLKGDKMDLDNKAEEIKHAMCVPHRQNGRHTFEEEVHEAVVSRQAMNKLIREMKTCTPWV